MRSPLSDSELSKRIAALSYDLKGFVLKGPGALVLSYSFENTARFLPSLADQLSDWSPGDKQGFRESAREISRYIDVTFRETTGASPDVVLYRVEDLGAAAGVGGFNLYADEYGDVNMTGVAAFRSSIDLGEQDSRDLILHEAGHILTLKHPGPYDAGEGQASDPPYLPRGEDHLRMTVMSYNPVKDGYGAPETLMIYDIAALQARFGANMGHRTGNDVYTAPKDGGFSIVWDAGGWDRIEWSGKSGAFIDTRGGSFSDLGARNNFALAYGVEVEAARGGPGDDTLVGGVGAQNLDGGAGRDKIRGGADGDRLIGGAGNDLLLGQRGSDELSGGPGGDRGFGGGGNDRLRGNGGDDRLSGQRGADKLVGGSGDDMLKGGAGDDVLRGGRGDDVLVGGAGADVFRFSAAGGRDAIRDFVPGVDHIASQMKFDQLTIRDAAKGALIEGGGASLLLKGVDADEIGRDDFIF